MDCFVDYGHVAIKKGFNSDGFNSEGFGSDRFDSNGFDASFLDGIQFGWKLFGI